MPAYTLPNELTTDWILHDDTWKPGTDRNWKVADWKLVPWVKQMIASIAGLPLIPANGDAYMIALSQVYRWNSNTVSYDIFTLAGAFDFYDQFTGLFYKWEFGTITVRGDGDVIGPASSIDGNIAVFDLLTGKKIKDGGMTIAQILALITTTDVRLPRPSFSYDPSSNVNIIIPSAIANKTSVKIAGIIYSNNANVVIDLTTNGANGLDVGALTPDTVYYIYAIKPVVGTTYRGVASLAPPTTGPTGFGTDWSYLGSYQTDSNGKVLAFHYFNGTLAQGIDTSGPNTVVVNSTVLTAKTIICSTVAKKLSFTVSFGTVTAEGVDLRLGSLSTNAYTVARTTNASNIDATQFFHDLEILEPNTLYGSLDTAANSANLFIKGWQENPLDYQ